MFKCRNCKLIFEESGGYFDSLDGHCPKCGNKLVEMCPNDNGGCSHGVIGGIKICDICGEFMCPECGNHDVEVLSRITGYYSPVESWNAAKRVELTDRVKYSEV